MFTIAFWSALFLTWPALIVAVVIGIIFESNEAHEWAVFTGAITALISFFFFNIALESLFIAVVGYLLIGLLWSFWRYKRHADKIVAQNKDASIGDRQYSARRLHPSAMLDKLSAWVLIWPFSVIENLIGDFVTVVRTAISRWFKGVYNRIYDSAIKSLLPENQSGS